MRARDRLEELLRAYRAGEVFAYVSSDARREQGLKPLTLRDEDVLLNIGCGPDVGIDGAKIRSLAPDRAVRLLEKVLQPPGGPIHGLENLMLHLQHNIEEVSWVLEELEAGITGVILKASIWTTWPADVPERALRPYLEGDRNAWWDGFSRVTDDQGARYEWAGGKSEYFGPELVTTPEGSGYRVGQRYTESRFPAVESMGGRLSITPSPVLRLEQPSKRIFPWPMREVSLGDVTYTVELPDLRQASQL